MEVEIGIGKSGRRAYGFDDIAIVPSRRTRDPEDVDISWEIDAFKFELPLLAAAMDGVVSPGDRDRDRPPRRRWRASTSKASGPATRTPSRCSRRSQARHRQGHRSDAADLREPIKPELVAPAHPRDQGRRRHRRARRSRRSASSSSPTTILDAELDLLVIQGTVVSAEHVSKTVEPLNLKKFIREFEIPVIVGGCAVVPGGAAPHADGRGRRPRRRRPRPRLHHPRRARHRRAAGHRHRRRRRRPHASPRRDRRLRARHRRRRHEHAAATSPRPSPAAPTR